MTSIFTKLKTNLKHALVPLSLCLLLGGISGTSYATSLNVTRDLYHGAPYTAQFRTKTMHAEDFRRVAVLADTLPVLMDVLKVELEMDTATLCSEIKGCDDSEPGVDSISQAARDLSMTANSFYFELTYGPVSYINHSEVLRANDFDRLAWRIYDLHKLLARKSAAGAGLSVPYCTLVSNAFAVLGALIVEEARELIVIGDPTGDT